MHKKNSRSPKLATYALLAVTISLISIARIEGQVTADFTADDTSGCTPFLVHFTNTGSTGPEFDYFWTFGAFGTSDQENPEFTFNSPGDIPVTLSVTNHNTLENDQITKYIHVILTPNAAFGIDSTNACVNGDVQFHITSTIDSAYWNFDDGSDSTGIGNYIYHAYGAYGTYNVQCITFRYVCSDTAYNIVKVDGPIADFSIDPPEACKGSPVVFTMDATYDVLNYEWDFGDGTLLSDENPVTHSYDTMGYIDAYLTVTGATGICTIKNTLHLYEVIANFEYADTRCHEQPVAFTNISYGNTNNFWDFGNGTTSMVKDPIVTYSSGTYNVKLVIENNFNCTDSIEKEIVIHPLPEIFLTDDTTVCPGQESTLHASGGDIIFWTPSSAFNDPTSYNPIISPDSVSVYTAVITDTSTHCTNTDDIIVYVQEGFVQGKITVFPTDTSLIIGDSISVAVFDSLGRDLTYEWTSDNVNPRISCTDCPNPTMQPLRTTVYNLVVSDTNRCFQSETFTIAIEIREVYRIGVPKAFTPNNDYVNDIIKVDGWGMQELIEFRIFNRQGIEVFYTDDISVGWDGYYKNKLQNVDTYSYIIKAKMWDDNITTIQGTFSLLR
jgi:gliding motility-associated-like protein